MTNQRRLFSGAASASFLAAVVGISLLLTHAPHAGTAAGPASLSPVPTHYRGNTPPPFTPGTPACPPVANVEYIGGVIASTAPRHFMIDESYAVSSAGQAYLIDGGLRLTQDLTPTEQGVLAVEDLSSPCNTGGVNPSTLYNTPRAEGLAWITAVNGDTVTYETAAGMIGTFDYVSDAFVGPETPDPHYTGMPGPTDWLGPGRGAQRMSTTRGP